MAKNKAKMNKFVTGVATAAMVATAVVPVASAAGFTDLGENVDAGVKADIDKAVTLGFFKDAAKFNPSAQITRGQAALTLARYIAGGEDEVENYAIKHELESKVTLFDDIPLSYKTGQGFEKELFYASLVVKNAGAFTQSNLNPAGPVTRSQMAKIVTQTFGLEKAEDYVSTITDIDHLDAATKGFIETIASQKVTVVDKFMPAGAVTRSQMASFLVRANDAAEVEEVDATVTSVSAINAKQLQVTFNKAMDADSVEDVSNYAIKRAGAASASLTDNSAATGANAVLSADGKTVTITLVNALTTTSWGTPGIAEGDTFNVELDELKAADGTKVAAQTKVVTYSDKVAPTFVSAMASGKTKTNTVEVTFSEPVDTSVATATINGTVVAITAGSTPNSVKLTSGSDLLVNTAYNVSLLNFKDFAGNLLSPNPVDTTVTVSSDVVAPVVSNVEVVRDNLLKVTFDKAIQASSLTANGTVKLLDANLAATSNVSGISAVNSSNKAFYVSLSTVAFNDAGNFTGTLVLTDAIKDAAGNALTATTKSVSLSKDVVAPQVVSSSFKNVSTYNGIATTNGAIVIKYNEAVTASAAFGTYKLIDNKTGVVISSPSAGITAVAVNPNDSTELVLTLGNAIASGSTTYTVVAPTKAVVDKSVSTNPSVAGNYTVDVTAGAPTVGDVVAPVITLGTEVPASTLTSGSQILVNIAETGSGLDTATALNTNNYRLDGLPLPAGSYVTLSGTTPYVATINLPAGTVAKNKAYNVNVNGIKDKAGNTALAFLGSATLVDDIQPELTTSALNTDGTVSLSFTENVITGVGTEADFELKVNDSAIFNTGTNKAFTIADGVGSDAGKYVITVKKSTESIQAATNTLNINGATYNTVGATDAIKFEFIDVNGSQSYDAGDILIKATVPTVAGGSAVAFATDGTYNLNNATSVKLSTKAVPTLVKDLSLIVGGGNVIKGSKTITIK